MRIVDTAASIILVSTLVLLSATSAVGSPESSDLLEPTVKRHLGILPESVCKELIALGDKEGFTVDEESIDEDEKDYNVISQSIEVFERDEGITNPSIWKALEPWIPQLTELVRGSIDKDKDRKYFPNEPDRVPQLGWVFFRKYSPTTERKSLKIHVDSNMHTLNIALNNDYEGGGFLFVKPPVEQQEELYDDRPEISNKYKSYEWVNGLQRKNTSDVVFPTLETGDVLIYNFTLWHAVAPIEVGTRYSFSLFFDMDNPAIQEDFNPAKDDDDEFPVSFYHEIDDITIDLVFVEVTKDGEELLEVMEEKMPPFKEIGLGSYDGHVFRALISGTNTVVSEFVMREDRHLYTITKEEARNYEL